MDGGASNEATIRSVSGVLRATKAVPRALRGRDVGPDPPSRKAVEPVRGQPCAGDDEEEACRSEQLGDLSRLLGEADS
jgi:hypothetical protein